MLKYNGGDSGINISVLYWRYSLIRVSVIRGSTVYHIIEMQRHNGMKLINK
jgi:hypothetical protein